MTGQLVSPVNSITESYSVARMSLAVLNPPTGTYKIGAPVITYSPSSTSSPVVAYGGNWLWLYDVATTAGPQLLQINAVNGDVVDTIATPQLVDPLMTASNDGVWLANSFRGGPDPYVLYHAVPGGSQLTGTLAGSDLHAYWLSASSGHVWLGAGTIPTAQTLYRFDGVGATIGLETPITGSQPFGEVVGDQEDGLWTVVASPPLRSSDIGQPRGQPLDVIRMNADTGTEQVMARVQPYPPSRKNRVSSRGSQPSTEDPSTSLSRLPSCRTAIAALPESRVRPTRVV